MKFMPLFILVLFLCLSGCTTTGSQYSSDPVIAQSQKWASACRQIGQSVITATQLARLGHLSQAEEEVMGRVVRIYHPICIGEPADLSQVITDEIVKEAVAQLCPEMAGQGIDQMSVTITQAAACAAREALLLELEDDLS